MNFCVIGAQKAGTTWLHHQLKNHPDIWLSPSKELHFFNYVYHPWPLRRSKNIMQRTLDSLQQKNRAPESIEGLAAAINSDKEGIDWYRSIFPENGQVKGDITPAYSIMNVHAFKYMQSHFPEARIIFIMRNPVTRFWSAYKRTAIKKNDTELLSSPRKILRQFEDEFVYRRMRYDWTLNTLKSVFQPSRVLFAYYEDIFFSEGGKVSFMQNVCEHIGVKYKSKYFPDMETVYLKSESFNMPDEISKKLYAEADFVINFCRKRFGRVPESWEPRG